MYQAKIQSFSEVDSYSAEKQFERNIIKEIDNKSKEYILGVDEDDFIAYMINEYSLVPLEVFKDSEKYDKPSIEKETIAEYSHRYREYEKEIYRFKVRYKFSGSSVLFKIRPGTWTMTSYEIYVDDSSNEVSLTFFIGEQDPEKFKKVKSDVFQSAFTNIGNANKFAEEWNKKVSGIVKREFKKRKNKFLKENDFFSAINISTNSETDSIFTVPSVKKVIIPQPSVEKGKEFSSSPTMAKKMYLDILKVIYDAGKSMEKKQALYKGKDEEGLRDQFLFILETRYESVTATGETFNKKGKTDIILKYAEDGTNVFVAECKFWKGASEFHKAINQLFQRYLTWRDSKVALIFFVTNKDFSNIISKANVECTKHDYYISKNGKSGDSSFSYIFRLPDDVEKEVYLELILFHFDEK